MSKDIANLLNKMVHNRSNVRFKELQQVCDYFFGSPRNQGSSHYIYKTPWPCNPRINIQNNHGKAKHYQIKQVLLAINKLLEVQNGR